MEAGSIISLSLSGVSILAAIWSVFKTNQLTKTNHQSEIFTDCTRRYHDIMVSMPDVMVGNFGNIAPEVIKYMTLYYDLCSEEFHLHRQGDITDEIWKNWEDGMRIMTRPEIYKTCWKFLSTNYNIDFVHFMHHHIFNQTSK